MSHPPFASPCLGEAHSHVRRHPAGRRVSSFTGCLRVSPAGKVDVKGAVCGPPAALASNTSPRARSESPFSPPLWPPQHRVVRVLQPRTRHRCHCLGLCKRGASSQVCDCQQDPRRGKIQDDDRAPCRPR
ncbi:hypothetical protein NDU88_009942 [Pleurodeles waltl]|uniref:Uncharacterized protein n=1 Tax=Pleurodeles waltl TaxID=8319 RepID=A0AAV7PTI0_PLEWA|nr:hypothetical protein NDU88_009942 [Pleurodeles waltl]